ncbi:DUF4245 domain-containing protein [Streptomyces ochraceiscleroticus]|uniref:DUF4245 domain-containing protein n=1 Tax=Streptomyces ochraceiscleroticus TaxID=47761 RepID=A0ABW1MFG7_9ACTN|nr:DUF4245 domain-containing protein [Streptomyces ochraceiscleroticus]
MRGKQTVRDMVLSMAVIGVVVAAIYFFIPHDDSKGAENSAVKTVGYRVELSTARRAAPYPVAAPEGLSKDWRATSVSYEASDDGRGGAWHLGFLNPKDQYAAVEQSDAPAREFIKKVTLNATPAGGHQQVDGARWDQYKGDTYKALVRKESGHTTVVTGTASYDGLAELAGALKAKNEK